MIFKIPLSNAPSQYVCTELSGKTFYIALKYSPEGSCWMASIFDSAQNPLCLCRRVESGFPIFWGIEVYGVSGVLMAMPTSMPEKQIGVFPWGSTHELVYSDETV